MPEYQLPRNLQAGTPEHALYLTYILFRLIIWLMLKNFGAEQEARMSFILKGLPLKRFWLSAKKHWKFLCEGLAQGLALLQLKLGREYPRFLWRGMVEIKKRLQDFP